MLGLGNTLSGGIVPAAAVAGFADAKCIDGMDSTSKYLVSTSDMPTLFTSASQQDWTIVMRLYHNATGNKGLFDFDFSGSGIYIFAQNFGQTLWWVFTYGQSGGEHQPLYSDNIANENATIIITKTGSTNADIHFYANGGGRKITNSNAGNTVPVITSAMTSFRLGIRDASFHFGGNKFNDFAIFDAAFTEAEATEAYNSGTTMDLRTHSKADNLKHYWLMGDGDDGAGSDDDGDTIYDMVGDCDLDMYGMDADDIVDF